MTWRSWLKLDSTDCRMGFLPIHPKRFWAIVAIAGLLIGGLILGTPPIIRYVQLQQLRGYLKQDIKALEESDQEHFENLIDALTPEATVLSDRAPQTWQEWIKAPFKSKRWRFFCDYDSWYLWPVQDRHGQERLILFQASRLRMIPGESAARVFILDSHGKVMARSGRFTTGYRIHILDASLHWEGEYGFRCLKITTRASISGADIAARYYAILDDWSIAPVRLEDSAGHFLNYYREYDLPPMDRSADEWEASLISEIRGEVLATLVWIGAGPTQSWPGIKPDELKRIELIRDLCSRPRVRTALQEFRKSNDAWVQEAANAAWQTIERSEQVGTAR